MLPACLATAVPWISKSGHGPHGHCLLAAGAPLSRPTFMQAQRWGSAFPAEPFNVPYLKAESAKLVACGDFCLGPGIENAANSASAAALAIKQMLE